MSTPASASSSISVRSGGQRKYSGRTPYARRQQHLGQQHAGTRGGAERDPAPSSSVGGTGGDQVDREDRTVAADGEVGQQEQFVRVAQVLHQRDGADVEVAGDEGGVEPVRGVLVQVDAEQRARAHEPPVDRQAVQELDVSDPGPRLLCSSPSTVADRGSPRMLARRMPTAGSSRLSAASPQSHAQPIIGWRSRSARVPESSGARDAPSRAGPYGSRSDPAGHRDSRHRGTPRSAGRPQRPAVTPGASA